MNRYTNKICPYNCVNENKPANTLNVPYTRGKTVHEPEIPQDVVDPLTSIVAYDGLVPGGEHPDHGGTVLGPGHNVTVLIQVTLRARDTGHHIKVAIHHLKDLPY